MQKLISVISSGLLIGLLALSAPAYAQVDVNVGGGASGSSNGADADASADADATIDIGSDDAADTGEPADGSGKPDPNTGGETGVSFSLSQKDAASASIDAESAELSASSVLTADDLSAYATAHMKRDTNIEHVEVTEDRVSLTYRQDARFLGFVPGSIKATAEVSANGDVEIDYPWYRFLFAVEGAEEAEATLAANVAGYLRSVNAAGSFTVSMEAELLDAIYAAFSGAAQSRAVADVTTADMAGDVSGDAAGTFEAGSPEAEDAADDPDAVAQ